MIADTSLKLLRDWARAAEADWTGIPGRPDFGVYGTGYGSWGVQTQQKYLAAMAVLGARGGGIDGVDTQWARDRALAALRFNLDSHLSGSGFCTDGARWGHTWISALGVERMMHGVDLLRPFFTEQDEAALRRMLTSEASWLLTDYQRGPHKGITGTRWNSEGGNDPESNIWNGALLWRAAVMYPDHPSAEAWRERAHAFLLNGVSVVADAANEAIVAGKPVRERHVGPNFFDHYALDHHGYLNVGYMVICVSNAAMLHFDLKAAGLPRPESLDHRQAELWDVVRRMIFADGRLARIGGDTRVRYAYCQDYLLPSLLYAADRLGDTHAAGLVAEQLRWVGTEAADAGDGGFYSKRLAALRRASPYYYTRLESDRACALGMVAAYAPLTRELAKPANTFEASVSGGWCEPEHGAALHRSETRFASFAWRANGLAQGLCLPPSDGHLAEWENNLAGVVEFCHHPHPLQPTTKQKRRLERCHVESLEGGFITDGAIMEGVDLSFAEGWGGTNSALNQAALAALPDGHTVIGLQYCRMGARRGYVASACGLQLNIPNDLFNGGRRNVVTQTGELVLDGPPATETTVSITGRWANVEGRIGAVMLHGDGALALHRHPGRRAGELASLHTERLCFPFIEGPRKFEAGETILDAGWAVLSSVDADQTQRFAETNAQAVLETGVPETRALRVQGTDGRTYVLVANFGQASVTLPAGWCAESPKALTLEAGRSALL